MRKLTLSATVLVLLFECGRVACVHASMEQALAVPAGPALPLGTRPSGAASADWAALLNRLRKTATFKTASLDRPKQGGRLTSLLPDEEDHRIRSIQAAWTFSPGVLKGESELAYSPSLHPFAERRGIAQHRLLRYGLSGTQGVFRYGLTYREAGKAYVAAPDQATREAWGEWMIGVARLRTSLTESWNNLEKDPLLARTTQTQEKVALTIAPPSWPATSLSYARTSSASSLEPSGVIPQRNRSEALTGELSYPGSAWNTRFSSSYTVSGDPETPGMETVGMTHALGGSVRLLQALTIAPSVTLREDRQRWSGVGVENPSASLTLTYAPRPSLSLTTTGSYSRTHSTDGLVDADAVNAQGVVTWTSEDADSLRTRLSLESAYARSFDAITHVSLPPSIAVFLKLHLTGF